MVIQVYLNMNRSNRNNNGKLNRKTIKSWLIQKNFFENYLQKPESPLWQISSTQTSVVPTSSSIETSTSTGPTPSSHGVQSPSASVSQPHNTARDEIYIDDEGIEGSGGRGEVRMFCDYFPPPYNTNTNTMKLNHSNCI